MTHSNEALSRLRGITLEDLTVEQLSSVLGPSSISPNINGQFEQASLLANAVSAQRTYALGLPIPEAGTIVSSPLAAESGADFQPPGTEEWLIMGIGVTAGSGTPTIQVLLFDGSLTTLMHSGASSTSESNFMPLEVPFTITNSLYLRLYNTHASDAAGCTVAYQKVSL
jgi:hypothetical protein